MSGKWAFVFACDWEEITDGIIAPGYVGKHLKKLVDREGSEKVRPVWREYLQHMVEAGELQWASPSHFARIWGTMKPRPKPRLLTADELDERAGIPLRKKGTA